MLDVYGAEIPTVDDEKGSAQTLDARAPITMTEYISLAELAKQAAADPEGASMSAEDQALWDGVLKGCWILDEDGWAYWSQPLAPGTATNLLLDDVTLVGKEPTDDWYYAIDVKLQAVSLNETTTTWQTSGGYSTNAATLIESWNAE